ncbi:MAG TPA: TMEM175 family protein [Chitinophagaceae bacterium]|nr:TMEM175 family protein [Chitinophagaceae bacterium]
MQHPNNKMQVERLLFFSDAVIAIAITLLIIEIKPPHLGGHAEPEENIRSLIPKFIAFLISFFVIAIYWKAHHHLFGFITTYSDKLIWINTFFLLSIVVMPFSSALYSENFGIDAAYAVYCINIILTGVLNCWLVRCISAAKPAIATVAGNKQFRTYYMLRGLIPPLVFLISLLVSYWSPTLSRICFMLIFPFIALAKRRYGKFEG